MRTGRELARAEQSAQLVNGGCDMEVLVGIDATYHDDICDPGHCHPFAVGGGTHDRAPDRTVKGSWTSFILGHVRTIACAGKAPALWPADHQKDTMVGLAAEPDTAGLDLPPSHRLGNLAGTSSQSCDITTWERGQAPA